VKRQYRIPVLAMGLFLLGSSAALAADVKEKVVSFGALEAVKAETARAQAEAWLKEVGKADPATMQRLAAVWAREDRTVLDRVADSLALGNADAARLLDEVRNPQGPAPTEVPAVLKDAKLSRYFRANLALAYGRALSNRRVHEEALETLKLFQPEQVVAPAAYLFHRAVCEHALLNKKDASRTINRLLDDSAADSPDRYKTVSALMLLDMETWKDKDLGAIARKMENIERRLELARGGPHTQKLQKEVLARLDELIKELENKAKKKQGDGQGSGDGKDPNGGGCPNGGPPGNQPGGANNPSNPMPDSQIANQGGSGRVDPVKFRKLLDGWGRMQPREQARAIQELTRGMSPRHREAIENYFRNLAQGNRK
jgi:hypothetical protein